MNRSEASFERAAAVLPGAVNSPVRAMGQIDRSPIFIASGQGCRVVDVDGNSYIDWVSSWGPLILGHAEPGVFAAVEAAARRGTSFGAATEGEIALAEEVCSRMPSVEMLRMTSSGTEAAMSAVRLARAATGRDQIAKFAGCYHGHSDGLLVEAGSALAERSLPASQGVTAAQAAETVVLPWNDPEAVEQALAGRQIAALIAEPIPANMGVVLPSKGFLARLRELCDRYGTLLIFDEVISGFRVARGGAQELYGTRADITVFGKVIGGGLPSAAFGGGRELMSMLAPLGGVYQAGTLSGNPLAVAAGLATLRRLDDEAYRRLAEITERMDLGIRQAITVSGRTDLSVASVPGLFTPFFRAQPPTDFAEANDSDGAGYSVFCRGLLERGIYPPPSRFEAWFPGLAHDDEAIERSLDAIADVLAEPMKGDRT